jgi:hypothetical protein
MADPKQMTRWLRSHYIFTSLLLLSAGLVSVKLYSELTMPPPLVYLIPEDFFGPIFVLYNQQDGVDPLPDPLGQAVKAPENGLVKIRTSFRDTVSTAADARPFIMVKVSPDGQRKILFIHGAAQRNDAGSWESIFIDDQGTLHRIPSPSEIGKPSFYYFSDAQRTESMVFRATGCAYQKFSPKAVPSSTTSQPCGKFLVLTPNMVDTFGEAETPPEWMWDNLDGEYDSVRRLETDLNEVMKKKKEWLATIKR